MDNRFFYDECTEEIFDSKIEDYPATSDICSILNKQEVTIKKYKEEVQKSNVGIAHLKNQLKQVKQQFSKKDKEIEHLKDCNESLSNKFDKESDMQNEIDILKYNEEGLEQQLAKKDERIAELEREVAELHTTLNQLLLGDLAFLKPQRDDGKSMKKRVLLDLEKDIRHEICEKIKEFIAKDLCGCSIIEWKHKFGWSENLIKIFNKLDQIEGGE